MKNFQNLLFISFIAFSGILLTGCQEIPMEADLQEMEEQESKDAILSLEIESESLLEEEILSEIDLERLENIDLSESETIIEDSEIDLESLENTSLNKPKIIIEDSKIDLENIDLEDLENISFDESETILENLEAEMDLLFQEESLLDAEFADLEFLDF